MNDQPTTSGSRWEPTDQTNQPAPEPAAHESPAHDTTTYAGPSYATPRTRMPGRSRAVVAGAAVGLLGVAGLGGWAIGASTAGGERGDDSSVVDVNGRFGDRDGGPGGGLPPGFDQRQGQLPPEPGDGDLDGDTGPGSRT